MPDWLKNIINKIKNLNVTVTEYQKETVIQSLPTVACVNRAKKLLDAEKYEDAKQILLQALELPHKDSLVYKYLGITYDKLKDFPNAVDAYQLSADLNPHDKIIWQKLGFALMACTKFIEAEKSFDNANKIFPGNTDTYTGWGMALMKLNRLQEASEKFAEASRANKYNFTAIFLAAVINIKREEYDKADAKLAFLANICPNESNVYEFANVKYLKGDVNNAIFYAKKSLEYNPAMLPAYLLLGKLYTKKSDKDTALAYYQEAFDKELVSSQLYADWAKALEQFGMYEEAKEKLMQGLASDPDNIELISHLGFCYVEMRNINEAKPLLEKVLTVEPENIIVKKALGIIAYEENDTEKSVSYLKETLDDDADDSLNYYYLAKNYERLNNDEKIRENYESALDKNPKFIQAYLDYVKYFVSKNEYAEALRKLRKANKADETNLQVLNLLFFVSYKLVKDNGCEYNIKETLAIANKVEMISPEQFEYPEQKAELAEIMKNKSESDEN